MSFLDALPDYGSQPQAQPAAQSGASFLDQLPEYSGKSLESSAGPQTDNRSAIEKLTGSGGTRYQTWPERMARGAISQIENVFTAPHDALTQGISPEREASVAGDTIMLGATPANPAVAAGDRIIPGIARSAILPPPAGLGAAETAARLGAPLPAGVASDSRAVQAVTQAARQLPMVGQKIDTQTGKAVGAAGDAVQSIADDLAGGVADRASTGAALRPSLKGVIEENNAKVDEAFSGLRGMLNQSAPSQLPRTAAVLDNIVTQRTAAGHVNPNAGLEDVANLVDKGATFDGLQRARSDIGNSLNFGEANPGFNKGDLKRLYAAMSSDMDNVVRQSAKPGVNPESASQALASANSTAAPLFDINKTLQNLLNIKSDEGVSGSVIRSAQDKTGNVKLLAQLRASMPAEDFQKVAGTALSDLGHNASTGKFSLSQFATQWDKLGDRAKGVLFSGEHRQYLDNIAALGRHLKDADKYANTSGTGRAAMLGSIVTGVTTAGVHALGGDVMPLVEALGAMGGGYALASVLARPAAAASMAKWSRTVLAQSRAPSPIRASALTVATRNLVSNLADSLKLPAAEVVRQLQAPMKSAAQPDQPEIPGHPAQ